MEENGKCLALTNKYRIQCIWLLVQSAISCSAILQTLSQLWVGPSSDLLPSAAIALASLVDDVMSITMTEKTPMELKHQVIEAVRGWSQSLIRGSINGKYDHGLQLNPLAFVNRHVEPKAILDERLVAMTGRAVLLSLQESREAMWALSGLMKAFVAFSRTNAEDSETTSQADERLLELLNKAACVNRSGHEGAGDSPPILAYAVEQRSTLRDQEHVHATVAGLAHLMQSLPLDHVWQNVAQCTISEFVRSTDYLRNHEVLRADLCSIVLMRDSNLWGDLAPWFTIHRSTWRRYFEERLVCWSEGNPFCHVSLVEEPLFWSESARIFDYSAMSIQDLNENMTDRVITQTLAREGGKYFFRQFLAQVRWGSEFAGYIQITSPHLDHNAAGDEYAARHSYIAQEQGCQHLAAVNSQAIWFSNNGCTNDQVQQEDLQKQVRSSRPI